MIEYAIITLTYPVSWILSLWILIRLLKVSHHYGSMGLFLIAITTSTVIAGICTFYIQTVM